MINLNNIVKVFDGGEGSGHFNHVGIPNHKGGSARSGKFRSNQNNNFVSGHIKTNKKLKNVNKIKKRIPGISDEDAKTYKNALDSYTGVEYSDIKYAYRDKYAGKEYDKGYEKISNDLDDFIYRSDKFKGTVYRGLNVSEDVAIDIVKNLKQGKTMDMGGISSWSSNRKISESFSTGSDKDVCILFTLDNKSGVSIKELSMFEHEEEVLHPTTARYKLNSNKMEIKTRNEGDKEIKIIEINLKEV